MTPISGKQCIDIPWADPYFLAGQWTPAQTAFLTDWEEGKTVYTQITGEASVSGKLIELPAGPLGIAAGVTIREDKINDTPGSITLAGNAWGASSGGITAGKSVTSEAFGELNVPIFADKPFFQDLTLSLAGRLTNVKATKASNGASHSDNGNFTYKVGLNWAINDWVRLRGSYGTSFRAPALFEQFLADETSFATQNRIDPCVNWAGALATGSISQRIADNCAADGIPGNYVGGGISATVISSGGLGVLQSETSKAKTAGIVFTPKFDGLPNTKISLAVDYFDIRVRDEISQLGAGTILFGCYNSESFATEPLCNLFTRGQNTTAIYQINTITDKFINIDTQHNSGIDVAARLEQKMGDLGTFTLTGDMTWQIKDDINLLATSTLQSSNGEAGSPKWVGDFRATWRHPSGFSLFYGLNVIGATSDEGDFLRANGGNPCINSITRGTYCPDLTAPATFYHNISVTQDVADKFKITAGIANLFDTRPPRVSVLNGGTIGMLGPVVAASQYPFQGRRIFINASAEF